MIIIRQYHSVIYIHITAVWSYCIDPVSSRLRLAERDFYCTCWALSALLDLRSCAWSLFVVKDNTSITVLTVYYIKVQMNWQIHECVGQTNIFTVTLCQKCCKTSVKQQKTLPFYTKLNQPLCSYELCWSMKVTHKSNAMQKCSHCLLVGKWMYFPRSLKAQQGE